MSIAWPRILPTGHGPVNERGVDFYDRLTDTLLAAGITPWVTLFHWDLPQPLEDEGGWRVRSTAEAYANYARTVVKRLGDRVTHWFTLNEIPCFIGIGYSEGRHAPGAREPARVVNQAYHHALLAHGYGVQAVRECGGPKARVGLVHNPPTPMPVTETPGDCGAAQAEYADVNAQLMGPLFLGAYPKSFLKAAGADAPHIEKGDLALISQPTDFLGLNIYTGYFMREAAGQRRERVPFPAQYPVADVSWLHIAPQCIYWAIRHAAEVYGVKTFYLTENGVAVRDEILPDGEIRDLDRREYVRNHLLSLHRALVDGYDVRGYFLWSLLDNYEWADGYAKRFGIVHVDYATQRRMPKLSAQWYAQVVRHNRIV